jgi:hypothetical protein
LLVLINIHVQKKGIDIYISNFNLDN